jgi:hypothetical protein
MAKRYEYFINLDERGEFNADVRDSKGKTIFEIDTDTAVYFNQDRIMRSSRDIDGLAIHLKEMGVISQDSRIVAGQR